MCYSEHAGKAEQLDVLFWVQVRGAVLLEAGCCTFRSCRVGHREPPASCEDRGGTQ